MTQADMDREIHNVSTGRLMRRVGTSGFKLVIVLGASKTPSKVRICVWSAIAKCWSLPQTARPSGLEPIVHEKLTQKQRKAVSDAIKHVHEHDYYVITGGLSQAKVGKPWLHKTNAPRPETPGVTQLAPITVSAVDKTKLQKLNNALSGWMFGGRLKK